MKTRNFILTALLAAFCLPAVLADTPALINYQGRLTAADGTPQSGDKAFTLNIWDAATGGTSLYQEDIGQVTLDDNGIYSFQFGANSENLAAALQNNSEHWIELTVDDGILSPRQRILAVPFALNAQKAEIAARAEKVGDENGNVTIEGTANVTGASTFSGPVMIADNATVQQDLDVDGKINAERIYLEGGPFGDIRFDGMHNRLFGEINEFRSDFSLFDGHRVDFNVDRVDFRNDLTLFRGMDVLFDNHRTIFDREVRLEGPITDPKHATTKEYVDALSARAAARVASLANVDLQNASPEIDGVTLAAGDRVLLAGQTSAAENGLYVADANGALTRAGDFDAANEIDGGAHLFIQEGSQAGQGYVLADLGENFELGTGELSFSRFTVDPTQSLALGDNLDVAGNAQVSGSLDADKLNANRIYLEGGPFGDTRFDGIHNRLSGEINEFRSFESVFMSDFSIFDGHRVDFRNEITLFRGNEVLFDTEVLLEGPITEPKHATTKEYVDALSARSAARVASLANVDLQNASPEIDGVSLAAGDRVLLAGQTSAAENGIYVADANGALTRAGDFDAANEIDGGAHLFIQEGSQAGQGYVLADLGENFELGTGELSFSRFTVDPTQSLALGNDLNVTGDTNVAGSHTVTGNSAIAGTLAVTGDADFSGRINADRLYLNGPEGETRLDGFHNRISGMVTEIRSDLIAQRNAYFESDVRFMDEVRFEGPIRADNGLNIQGDADFSGRINADRLYLNGPEGETRLDGFHNRISGMVTEIRSDLIAQRNAYFESDVRFMDEVRLEGPITDPKHATTKEYVDALSARAAARVASLANVDLQNASPEIDGVSLAAGDRVLLAGQTSAAENGLYVADANGALTRAGDFDDANEIDGGAHLFIQEGSQAGQGYVLADLGENFELGTGELSFSRFTVDPTQSLELGNDLDVAGTINAQDIQTGNINAHYIEMDGPAGTTRLGGLNNDLFGEFNRIRGHDTRFEGHRTVFDNDFIDVRGDAYFDREVRLEGPITEPKHATTKEYVDARIDTEAVRAQAAENNLLQLVQQQAAMIEDLQARLEILEIENLNNP